MGVFCRSEEKRNKRLGWVYHQRVQWCRSGAWPTILIWINWKVVRPIQTMGSSKLQKVSPGRLHHRIIIVTGWGDEKLEGVPPKVKWLKSTVDLIQSLIPRGVNGGPHFFSLKTWERLNCTFVEKILVLDIALDTSTGPHIWNINRWISLSQLEWSLIRILLQYSMFTIWLITRRYHMFSTWCFDGGHNLDWSEFLANNRSR